MYSDYPIRRAAKNWYRQVALRFPDFNVRDLALSAALLVAVVQIMTLSTRNDPCWHANDRSLLSYLRVERFAELEAHYEASNDTSVMSWPSRGQRPNEHVQHWKPSMANATRRILILTPMKDAEADIPLYFSLLNRLSYPKEYTSIGIIEGDSRDATHSILMEKFQNLSAKGEYRHLTLVHKNVARGNAGLVGHERHCFVVQARRRSAQAKVRNYLVSIALHDEDFVLWLDSDLRQYPHDIIERMLETGKSILSADCVTPEGGCYDRNNWRETPRSLKVMAGLPPHALMFEGYSTHPTHRQSLCDIDADKEKLVELQGVGGTALLVEGDLFREGLFFPTFPFEHALETEGLAQVALKMGVKSYGMTNLHVIHEPS
jgi:Anp1